MTQIKGVVFLSVLIGVGIVGVTGMVLTANGLSRLTESQFVPFLGTFVVLIVTVLLACLVVTRWIQEPRR